jgi:hypothetical protein
VSGATWQQFLVTGGQSGGVRQFGGHVQVALARKSGGFYHGVPHVQGASRSRHRGLALAFTRSQGTALSLRSGASGSRTERTMETTCSTRSGRASLLGLLEDACGVAGMQSVEYGRGYTCQFAYFRARWRESAFTRPGQNCSLPLAVSWTRGCLSATLRKP